MHFMEKGLISLDIEAEDAEQAIRAAGQLLVDSGAAEGSYVEAMVSAYRNNGPYIVIAPHIALPHAKAENGVREASVSFVRLRRPVAFGHPENDPVELVFALGSSSSSDHIALLRRLTTLLNDPANVEALKEAKTAEEIESIIQ
ncbi:MAG: PTS sugar transporter subunit IIA [Paenibacillus macerans]|uniref:Phosphoenolpyruvate-dependent sugar phosphotransferase system, EIIA 2 family protein n=1 Tax=Paenibacillus macerans TaxID=44252 RepID=A0A090ZG16_PAEMA|nr:PTS sugar transporter subunit IIA [Paenibacillus macerans]KFN10274.1 phosphoenolpyruvate-dependent sugar phosphotransferase system, EIIA 2 family protein [Paenibacillus macerans]MBS5909241.1 PTS sugar transporter subunit IIA [Paenibacillus macerans]MCY7556909.1 PTS sugar transporter subunit IIA [Paenibacillus macerans]MDU7476623.1 PTS sugar transporter subunit IIA [Paenibacillus macerans]MEC0139118.1 PTS sugar transporter subunit IIA [Paenibacillus macerans]